MHKVVFFLTNAKVQSKKLWRGLCIDDKVMVCCGVLGVVGLYVVATT